MSRRDSRASIGARQNDALFEFENFKKKFLLANKHITKLNSTLSIRIEELNAQISALSVENLRLRESEIALAAELRRERGKTHQILVDAETASQNFAKHLHYLRELHNIRPPERESPSPGSPLARRPVYDPEASPIANRVARPPTVPGIREEEEPCSSTNERDSPLRKKKAKPRLSASKLPLPTRSTSPHRAPTPTAGSSSIPPPSKPRKTLRRPSGLLEINTDALSVPRSASPAFGSPVRLEAGRAEAAEEYAAIYGGVEVTVDSEDIVESISKKERRLAKSKEVIDTPPRSREKKKAREDEGVKPKPKETSVHRSALQPLDSNVHDAFEQETTKSPHRQFLRPVSPGSPTPNSRGSISPMPVDDGPATGNRERRTRKSVNYAEPKLNTKMRKPEPLPGFPEPARKKRSSAAAAIGSIPYKPSSKVDEDEVENPEAPILPLRSISGQYIDPDSFPHPTPRPGAASAMYSPGPPTRTTGSTTSGSSTGAYSLASNSSSSTAVEALKRKKSRPLVISDEEEDEDARVTGGGDAESDDGAEADEEFVSRALGVKSKGKSAAAGSSTAGGSWVNLEGRRKAPPKRSAAAAAVAAIEDMRRHSMVL